MFEIQRIAAFKIQSCLCVLSLFKLNVINMIQIDKDIPTIKPH